MNSRINFTPEIEQFINNGINMHYSGEIMYNYLASICIYDNISMPCFGEFLRLCAMRMRHTAELMTKFQLIRGGQWQLPESLKPLVSLPVVSQNEKDVNNVMRRLVELALEAERKTERYLRELCQAASSKQDIDTCGFVQTTLIKQQRFILKAMVMHQTGLNSSQNAWLYCNTVVRPFVHEVKEFIEKNCCGSSYSHTSSTGTPSSDSKSEVSTSSKHSHSSSMM
ncbi:unnamed protein product, partial [Protopolystoma xenopodis]